MKNVSQWKPTKFVFRKGKLRASKTVRAGSAFVTGLLAEAYQSALECFARGKLLDLGCGQVPLYDVYRQRVSDVVCVDWSNSNYETSHIDFEHDLTTPLPFEDASFDTVLLTDVLEHIPNPGDLLNEVARVLDARGLIVIGVPFMYSIHEAPTDYFRFTEFWLVGALEARGFEVVHLDRVGGSLDVIVDQLTKNVAAVWEPLARLLSALALPLLSVWPFKIHREKTRHLMPLSYVLVGRLKT